jgi:myo-inositol-1(or 4)-monophosphatase
VTDRDLAAAAARAAAQIALERRGDTGRVSAKDAPTDVVSEVDRAAEAAAIALIAAERPDDGYVGEEGAAHGRGWQWQWAPGAPA